MLKGLATFIAATLMAFAAAQAGQPAPLLGVWKGTIGSAEVIACLQPDKDYAVGSYYYLNHLVPIPLNSKDGGASWQEDPDNAKGKDIPSWHVAADGPDSAKGQWQGNGKTLAIQLARQPVESDGADRPCGSWAFITPRMGKPVVTEKAMKLDGHDYTGLQVSFGKQFSAQLETFRLPETGDASPEVNAAIAKLAPFDGKQPAYADCIRGGIASLGTDGDYEVTVKPEMITGRFLALSVADGSFCGGAHPVNSLDEFVYDLTTGAKVDTFSWFKPELVSAKDMQFKGALLAAAVKAAKKHYGADMQISADDIFGWEVSLRKNGLLLAPQVAYVAQAGAEPFVVPFADMAPFLSPAGQAAVSAMP